MWGRYKGYLIVGFVAGIFTPLLPGLFGAMLLAMGLAALIRAAYNLFRSERALKSDYATLRGGGEPEAVLAWQVERIDTPIDRAYALGWFSTLGFVMFFFATLPPKLSSKLWTYAFLAELLVVLVLAARTTAARNRLVSFVAKQKLNGRHASIG